jgi:endoglucanase
MIRYALPLALLAAPAAAQVAPSPPNRLGQLSRYPAVPREAPSPIRLNQLGLDPTGPKRAMLADPSKDPLDWQLVDSAGIVRMLGRTVPYGIDAASGEHVHIIEFNDGAGLEKGVRLQVGDKISRAFDIVPGTRRNLARDALHFFYLHRAGMPIEEKYSGKWARPAGHPREIGICVSGKDGRGTEWPGCSYQLDVTGGWYDAGDQGKYVVNGGITLWTLLNAYEHNWRNRKEVFKDRSLAIPEAGNRVNDLLDEARYEIEFFLKMQVPDGTRMKLPVGAPPPFTGPPPAGQGPRPLTLPFADLDVGGMSHHKVGDRAWTKLPTLPHEDKEDRMLHPPSTAATLNLAATTAQCARLWKQIDAAFSARCLAASERAWAAAKRNPEVFAVSAFTGSGGYGDRDLSDEFYWAAAELYTSTGKPEYLEALRASPHFTKLENEPSWPNVAPLGTITLATVATGITSEEKERVRGLIVSAADRFLADSARNGYHIPYSPPGYPWGSTSNVMNRGMLLALAHDFTRDAKYRDGVIDGLDYILGRNPLDVSFVTGFGARPMVNPHHRFWAHSVDPTTPVPPPGVISGGPNNTAMADPIAQKLRGKCAPMTCWEDHIDSYAMNEIAINWNAPLFWVAAWLGD